MLFESGLDVPFVYLILGMFLQVPVCALRAHIELMRTDAYQKARIKLTFVL